MNDELIDVFVTASRALVGLAVRSIAVAPVEVTVAQHRALVLLAAAGEQTVGDLAEHLGVNQSNASRLCDRLESLELVARRRSRSDARVVRVGLTQAGRDVVDAVTSYRHAELSRVLARMSDGDLTAAHVGLAAFGRAADELPDRDWSVQQW